MRISEIALREIRLPLKEPFTISSGTVDERRVLLLEVTDADGHRAWSECVAGICPNYSAETVDTARLAIREWIAPQVLGWDLPGPEPVLPHLDTTIRGHRMAKAAVEMATWTLAAQREGVSLAVRLGGRREWVETGISIGIQDDIEALVDRARAAHAEGYRRIKVKIRPGADVESLRAVRVAMGSELPILADANSAYRLDDPEHVEALEALDDLDLMMIEQPLGAGDLVRHARLQQRLRTPICLDESITGRDRVEDMVALGAGQIVNIKAGRVGGLQEARSIHDFCYERKIPVWCGGMLETGIGRAYNVALASLPGFTIPGDISPSARYWQRDVVEPEWTMDSEGRVRVPRDRPGLGVEVDVDRIDDLTIDSEVLTGERKAPCNVY